MRIGKPQSKRVPVRLRQKIEKAAAAKQRKDRKLAKNNPEWRSRLKKDPGIPNLYPFKEQLLQEIAEKKRLKDEETLRRRDEERQVRASLLSKNDDVMEEDNADQEGQSDPNENDEMDITENINPMAALLASARARASNHGDEASKADQYEPEWRDLNTDASAPAAFRKDTSRRAFDKVFKDVVAAADVVLYVLDARDPEGTRSKEVERSVVTADGGQKRLILILNKIDLVPPQVLKGWLIHLRRSFPTLPVRASHAAPNAKTYDHKQMTVKGTSEALFRALKSYAQSKQLKRAISVGVIGYPNVGKSSVINALTSRLGAKNPVCPVGAEAGVTTSIREVKLDNKLKLLDCPGIVFPGEAASSTKKGSSKADEKARLILLNAVPPKEIDDPIAAVRLLLKRLSETPALQEKLFELYGVVAIHQDLDGDATKNFLVQVARKRGRLGKGGVPNLDSAAQAVITDWRDGRIQGWIGPPNLAATEANASSSSNTQVTEAAPAGDQKSFVSEWAAEFKLDGLWDRTEDEEKENNHVVEADV